MSFLKILTGTILSATTLLWSRVVYSSVKRSMGWFTGLSRSMYDMDDKACLIAILHGSWNRRTIEAMKKSIAWFIHEKPKSLFTMRLDLHRARGYYESFATRAAIDAYVDKLVQEKKKTKSVLWMKRSHPLKIVWDKHRIYVLTNHTAADGITALKTIRAFMQSKSFHSVKGIKFRYIPVLFEALMLKSALLTAPYFLSKTTITSVVPWHARSHAECATLTIPVRTIKSYQKKYATKFPVALMAIMLRDIFAQFDTRVLKVGCVVAFDSDHPNAISLVPMMVKHSTSIHTIVKNMEQQLRRNQSFALAGYAATERLDFELKTCPLDIMFSPLPLSKSPCYIGNSEIKKFELNFVATAGSIYIFACSHGTRTDVTITNGSRAFDVERFGEDLRASLNQRIHFRAKEIKEVFLTDE